MRPLCCSRSGIVSRRWLGWRHVFPWLPFLAGWELTCASVCISASPPGGTPCRPASPGGRGPCSQEQRRGCQVLRKYLRHRVHAGPHTLAHSPACSFNMGEAGLSVLAESSHWSPFWQRMGSVHQDHIPDAGTEILEG